MAECKLSRANGRPDITCDEEGCAFWRIADEIAPVQGDWSGCAIQHFALLDGGQEIAAWLISAKKRVSAEATRVALGEAPGERSGDE